MEPQKTLSPLEKEQSLRYNSPGLQTISNQDSMLLTQKQIHRSMELNRQPRNKPIHLWSINL